VDRRSGLLGLSLLVHGALGVGVASIEIKKSRASTAISYAENQKKKKPPEPTKVEEAPPEKAPPRALTRRAAPPPVEAEAPPPKAADTPAAFDGFCHSHFIRIFQVPSDRKTKRKTSDADAQGLDQAREVERCRFAFHVRVCSDDHLFNGL